MKTEITVRGEADGQPKSHTNRKEVYTPTNEAARAYACLNI